MVKRSKGAPVSTDDAARRFMQAASVGDWPVAEKALRVLLGQAPDNAALHYNLGLVLRHRERFGEALESVGQALALEPGHQGALFEQGACLMGLEELEEAEAAFTDYLKSFPGDDDALGNRARVFLRLGRAVDALADCEAIAAPTTDITLCRAEALRDMGRVDEADAILRPLYRDHAELRPVALKLMTQGPKGRMPLNAGILLGA